MKLRKSVALFGILASVILLILLSSFISNAYSSKSKSEVSNFSQSGEESIDTVDSSTFQYSLKDNEYIYLEELQQISWQLDGGPKLSFKADGQIYAEYSSGEEELYGTYEYKNNIIDMRYNMQQEMADGKDIIHEYSPLWKNGELELIPVNSSDNTDLKTLHFAPVSK